MDHGPGDESSLVLSGIVCETEDQVEVGWDHTLVEQGDGVLTGGGGVRTRGQLKALREDWELKKEEDLEGVEVS